MFLLLYMTESSQAREFDAVLVYCLMGQRRRCCTNINSTLGCINTAMSSQRAVSDYFTSKKILPFCFVEQYSGIIDDNSSDHDRPGYTLFLWSKWFRLSLFKPRLQHSGIFKGHLFQKALNMNFRFVVSFYLYFKYG